MAKEFQPQPDDPYWRIKEAAPFAGYSVKGFRRLLAQGKIAYIKINPRAIRVRRSSLEQFMQQHEVPARKVRQ